MSAALVPGSACTVAIAGRRVDGYIRSIGVSRSALAEVRLDTGEVAQVPVSRLGAPTKVRRG